MSRHVAVVVPTLASAGAERVARTLAEQMARGARVTVVTFDPRMSRRELDRLAVLPWADRVPPGCEHVHLPATGSGVRRLGVLAARFARLAHAARFDAVYSFLTYPNIVVAVSRALGRSRYVHVASEHALADNLHANGRGPQMLAATLPAVYRLPDHLVVVSDAARRSLRDAGVLPRPERAVTIPNPIDLAAVRELAAAPPARQFPEGEVLVACFARLHPQKDHRTLLRALELLPARFRLLVAGDGPLRAELEELAGRLGVAGRVDFQDAVDNPYPLMCRAGVVVLASREEGFGLVALEAAVLGVPFVGTEVGGLAELCAWLGQPTVAPGDAKGLAAEIERLASAGPRPVPAERLDRFDLKTVTSAYEALGWRDR
ncbi:glycosyltransferase [Actinoplanes solisilvae]|uniref:glycosyltransferase n=1 Tax=Actinoplanes solisilvae TaxID=2486853 RepID=UPI000FD90E86|nr:glycosyltransferase [Actinoplanes solisilvae]